MAEEAECTMRTVQSLILVGIYSNLEASSPPPPNPNKSEANHGTTDNRGLLGPLV